MSSAPAFQERALDHTRPRCHRRHKLLPRASREGRKIILGAVGARKAAAAVTLRALARPRGVHGAEGPGER